MTADPLAGLVGLARQDPPLTPSGPEGRSWLREELLDPGYHDRDLLERVVDWLLRRFDEGVARGSELPLVTTVAAVVAVFALAVGVLLLVSRARRDPAPRRAGHGGVLDEAGPDAATLRRRAEQAFAEGRHDDAVVFGYRALARSQVEQGALPDDPGATAHEVAVALARAVPEQAAELVRGADAFDEVLYGEHPADRDRAALVLGIAERLARPAVRR